MTLNYISNRLKYGAQHLLGKVGVEIVFQTWGIPWWKLTLIYWLDATPAFLYTYLQNEYKEELSKNRHTRANDKENQ